MKALKLTERERETVRTARSARLATADSDGHPNVVPICYALVSERIVTPLDEKPKARDDADLRRVRDIMANPVVAVLIDQYSEVWSDLWWIQIRGKAEILKSSADSHADGVNALKQKYEQYSDHGLSERPLVSIDPGHAVSWRPENANPSL